MNNYEYRHAISIINKVPHLSNGIVQLIENPIIASPVAQMHYQYYNDPQQLSQWVCDRQEQIQCIISSVSFEGIKTARFGLSQSPDLMDYADGIDTMQFLCTI
jgi:hypothetical protein